MIVINNLSFQYEKEYPILKNITINIKDGDFLAIIGDNGAGKSTLIKCILKINPVQEKKILIDGKDLNYIKNLNMIGYVAQINEIQHDIAITTLEYLLLYTNNKIHFQNIINKLKINDLLNKQLKNLSGGQKQKVMIARALLNPNLKYLILDEPTNGIDLESQKNLYYLLNDLNQNEKITIIIITHQLMDISCDVNKIYDLKNNKLLNNDRDQCRYCAEDNL